MIFFIIKQDISISNNNGFLTLKAIDDAITKPLASIPTKTSASLIILEKLIFSINSE